jgi:hypothetical protein
VRVLPEHESFTTRRTNVRVREHRFTDDIRDYWLERDVSLYQSAEVPAAIELLRSGRAEARRSAPGRVVHAKIYRSDGADLATRSSSSLLTVR